MKTYNFSVAVPGPGGTPVYRQIVIEAANIGAARHQLNQIVKQLQGSN